MLLSACGTLVGVDQPTFKLAIPPKVPPRQTSTPNATNETAGVAKLRLTEEAQFGRAQAALTGARTNEAADVLERLAGLEGEMTEALAAVLGSASPGGAAAG
jgi:hypothetical protein